MRILIVEDDPNKLAQVTEQIRLSCPDARIVERRSYQSGLKEILNNGADWFVLDMTLPTFDITATERGGRTRPFAGRELLREMKRRGITGRVIIVTQFESFGDGEGKMTLKELQVELTSTYPDTYLLTVYYHPAQSEWRQLLAAALRSRPND
jgi:CheY-like chemotaxis protein